MNAPDLAALAATVREARRRLRMTQDEVARASGVSVRSLHNLEHSRIAHPRWSTLRALAQTLEVDEAALARLTGSHEAASGPFRDIGGEPVTPLTPLVGRSAERDQIAQRLGSASTRIMTITGPAGIGKTRLAAAVAESLTQDGNMVWWVPLAAVSRTELVPSTIADAISVDEPTLASIARRLEAQAHVHQPIVVLDNVEHLPSVGHVIHKLLAQAPGLTVLATSRAPLSVDGEYEWPLAPLELPDRHATVEQAISVPSVALFAERVAQAVPQFVLERESVQTISLICHEVGGLPLALELAAAQWRVRGGDETLASLRADPLAVRHLGDTTAPSLGQALGATLELLSEHARRTLHQLAVFAGGWSWDAAAAVVDTDDLARDLDRLVAFGLVQIDDGGGHRRYEMLPVIKALAERGAGPALLEQVGARHAVWFTEQAVRDGNGIERHRSARLMRAFDADRHNYRVALDWLAVHEPESGLRLACGIRRYWYARGHHEEGVAIIEALCSRADDLSVIAEAHGEGALLLYALGRVSDAVSWAEEAQADAVARGNRACEARALLSLGCMHLDEPEHAEQYERRALAAAEEVGEPLLQTWALVNLAVSLMEQGKFADADPVNRRASTLTKQHAFHHLHVLTMSNMAEAALLHGDGVAAEAHLTAVEPELTKIDDLGIHTSWAAESAIACATTGQLGQAQLYLNKALALARDAQLTTKEAVIHHAEGEIALAKGMRNDAVRGFRRALDAPSQYGGPVWRVYVLTRLAEASDDAGRNDVLAEVTTHLERRVVALPRTLEERLESLRERTPA